MNNNELKHQPTAVYDTLQSQTQKFNLAQGRPQSLSTKEAMQQLYKNQLDNILYEKQKQKHLDRLRLQNDRREFNQRAEQSKEAEKIKQISYKNYYNMLMNNQAQNQQSYVSPFSKREAMKDTLISQGLEEQRQRNRILELQIRKRKQQQRLQYRNQLLGQIEDKKKKDSINKNQDLQQKQKFQKYSKLPEEITRYQREKKKEEHQKYREDLDKIRQYRSQSQSDTGLSKVFEGSHNILTNPLPYNIQNPYILREMGIKKNHSYLAMKGEENVKL